MDARPAVHLPVTRQLEKPCAAAAADGFSAKWNAGKDGAVSAWIHDHEGTCEGLTSFCLLFVGDKASKPRAKKLQC